MARPLRITYPGAFYHITSRGNERQAIFKNRADRLRFLAYLESATERYRAVIHCYCLMVNHYHLLLETPLGNLPQIMRHINGAYTTYFNIKRDRSGHLFQGGTPLKAIGERYGLGESGVSQVGRRLDTRKAEDAALRLVMAKIDRAINKSSGST